jgi:aryl carrier-like protein
MREAMDGLYELFLVRDPKLELYQGVFNTFPNIQEWSMNDLYSRHPDLAKGFLYMYKGRKDDVIVLSNGEKIAPALMEATLMSDPLVRGAMVVGRAKFQPAALIDLAVEPPKDARQRHQMVERLLPIISEANEHAPAHGKLDQYHILFASPEKPIYYLGQGKIQRYRTYNLHEGDIEELYRYADDANEQFGFSNLPKLDFASEGSVTQWLKQLTAEIADVRGLDMDQDLFEAGIDSLQVIRMARELKFQAKRAGLGNAVAEEFLPTTIYSHPTLDQLTAFILRQADVEPQINGHINGRVNGHVNNHANSQLHNHVNGHVNNHVNGHVNNHVNGHVKGHIRNSTSKNMQALLHAYADSLPRSSQLSPPPSTENMTVVLTGSTGSVGSYLLEALYHNQNVSHIICLNRSSNAAEKHNQTGPRRGLSPLNRNRVEFIKADLSEPQLGLEASVYQRMLKTVTHVIREFQCHSHRSACG